METLQVEHGNLAESGKHPEMEIRRKQ